MIAAFHIGQVTNEASQAGKRCTNDRDAGAAAAGTLTGLGIATASPTFGIGPDETALFAGQAVSGRDLLVKYTYAGDADLDRKLNIDDYVKIDSGISAGLNAWLNGDFN